MPSKKQKLQPVEKFMLSPELVEVQKAFQDRQRLGKILKGKLALQANELSQLTNAVFAVEKQQEALIKMVPPNRQEVEGIPMDVSNMQINY